MASLFFLSCFIAVYFCTFIAGLERVNPTVLHTDSVSCKNETKDTTSSTLAFGERISKRHPTETSIFRKQYPLLKSIVIRPNEIKKIKRRKKLLTNRIAKGPILPTQVAGILQSEKEIALKINKSQDIFVGRKDSIELPEKKLKAAVSISVMKPDPELRDKIEEQTTPLPTQVAGILQSEKEIALKINKSQDIFVGRKDSIELPEKKLNVALSISAIKPDPELSDKIEEQTTPLNNFKARSRLEEPFLISVGEKQKESKSSTVEFLHLTNSPLRLSNSSLNYYTPIFRFQNKRMNILQRNQTIPHPCSCRWTAQNCGCNCSGSLNYNNFKVLSRSFQPCSNFSFIIQGGDHYALPPNLFSQVGHVKRFHLKISNATFESLFDPTPQASAFQGVSFEESAMLQISGVGVRREWNWSPLDELTPDFENGTASIYLEGCGLKRLSSDFANVVRGAVKELVISDSNLETVGSGAFSNFDGLIYFRVPRNNLQSFKRTDLPLSLKYLLEIDLRDNRITSLDADTFTAMPSLESVSLSGNPLRVISEDVFSSIIGRIRILGLSDFPLYCDCKLKWLKSSVLSNNSIISKNLDGATCRRPPYLRGTPFKDLSEEHLICKN